MTNFTTANQRRDRFPAVLGSVSLGQRLTRLSLAGGQSKLSSSAANSEREMSEQRRGELCSCGCFYHCNPEEEEAGGAATVAFRERQRPEEKDGCSRMAALGVAVADAQSTAELGRPC